MRGFKKLNVSKFPCIYFLMYRGTVIYIGKTLNLYCRIHHHMSMKRKFDEVFYKECHRSDMDRLEKKFIKEHKPKGNLIWVKNQIGKRKSKWFWIEEGNSQLLTLYKDGLSMKEIAKIMDITPNNVATKICKLRSKGEFPKLRS